MHTWISWQLLMKGLTKLFLFLYHPYIYKQFYSTHYLFPTSNQYLPYLPFLYIITVGYGTIGTIYVSVRKKKPRDFFCWHKGGKTGASRRSYADFFPNSGITDFAALNNKSALVKISHRMIGIIELDRYGSSWNGGYVSSYPSQYSKYTDVNEVENDY